MVALVPGIHPTHVRREIEAKIRGVARSGDVIFRYGEAQHFQPLLFRDADLSLGAGIRFSKIVCEMTDPVSPFSHAAVLEVVTPGDVRVWDMSDEGLRRPELVDWMRETQACSGLEIRRVNQEYRDKLPAMMAELHRIRDEEDPEYDYLFRPGDGRYYCTELVHELLDRMVVSMPPRVLLTDLPGYGRFHWALAKVGKIDLTVPIVHPGTAIVETEDPIGMRSSPHFGVVLTMPAAA